jgi:hypothetical protein
VAVNDALHRGQPSPGTRKLFEGVQPLEGTEELVGVGHVKPCTVVSHKVRKCAFVLYGTEFDPCRQTLSGELPRVAQKVL